MPAAVRQEQRLDRLVLVTYNIWFGDYYWEERLSALLELVRDCQPDVVALQEVTPGHLKRILATEWVRREFWVSDAQGSTLYPHGVLTLSRLPLNSLTLHELPSEKDRKLLIAELGLGRQSICLGNLHLESSVSATPMRLAQLDRVLSSIQGARHRILLGDFNFDPVQEPEQARVDRHYLDLWEALRLDEPGYTEDTDINCMRLLHKNKEKQVRFDRILLQSESPGWRPESIRLIGTQPISPGLPDVFPSDHSGLTGSLVWTE